MLGRQGGKIYFDCDNCFVVLQTNTDDYDYARDLLECAGWTSREAYEDAWEHFCPKCSKDAA